MTTPITTYTRIAGATIEADPDVPIIRITRDFAATPAQLMRAHTDPELFARWVVPTAWTPGSSRGRSRRRVVTLRRRPGRRGVRFRGCFHQVTDDRIVQTFTFEGMPRRRLARDVELRGPRRRLDAPARPVPRRQLRGPRRLAGVGDGGGVDQGYAKLDAPRRRSRVERRRRPRPIDEYRLTAARFPEVVDGVADPADWDRRSPVPEWTARDVVGHLVDWVPAFSGPGPIELPPARRFSRTPSPRAPPRRGGPRPARGSGDGVGGPGEPSHRRVPLPRAVSQFFTADVFMHTWDLARATGQTTGWIPSGARPTCSRCCPGRGAACQRPVRPEGRGARRRRCADPPDGVHRTRPGNT